MPPPRSRPRRRITPALLLAAAAATAGACTIAVSRPIEPMGSVGVAHAPPLQLSTAPGRAPAPVAAALVAPTPAATPAAPPWLLPEDYVVHAGGNMVVNHPVDGLTPRTLPTRNLYRAEDGCYVACYSRGRHGAVYSVGGGINVMGQVRVRGAYDGRICIPEGFAGRDISADAGFKRFCGEMFSASCGAGCWAGGDTGGWFGIQP